MTMVNYLINYLMAFNAGDLVNFFFVYRSGGATGRRLVLLKKKSKCN